MLEQMGAIVFQPPVHLFFNVEKLDIAQYLPQIRTFTFIIWTVLKKLFGGHILRKFNIRPKMQILNSLIFPKNVEGGGDSLRLFNIRSVAKHQN